MEGVFFPTLNQFNKMHFKHWERVGCSLMKSLTEMVLSCTILASARTCCPTQHTLIHNEKQGENTGQHNKKDLPSLKCSNDEKQGMA
jgi:hypothetical protein